MVKGRLLATNRHRPCQVCSNVNGNCRINLDTGLVLCHYNPDYDPQHPDYRFLGTAKDGRTGKFIRRRDNDFDPEAWERKKEEQEAKNRELEWLRQEKTLSPQQKHDCTKTLFSVLSLDPDHKQILLDRGESESTIERCRTITPNTEYGYQLPDGVTLHPNFPPAWRNGKGVKVKHRRILIAIPNVDGLYHSLSVYNHEAKKTGKGAKYKPLGGGWQLPNEEQPAGFYYPKGHTPGKKYKAMGMSEGRELKGQRAADLLGMPVHAVAGHNFMPLTTKQIKEAMEQTGAERLVLIPDSEPNNSVFKSYSKVIEWAEKEKIPLTVPYWEEQETKGNDIDEIPGDRPIEYISGKEYLARASKWLNHRGWQSFRALTKVTRAVNIEFLDDSIQLFQPGKGVGVKSGMGTGKTHQLVKQCQDILMVLQGYRRSLNLQSASNINIAPGFALTKEISDFNRNDLINNTFPYFCVDSIQKLFQLLHDCYIDPAAYFADRYIFIDEVVSVIKHLLFSNTLVGKRIEVLELFIQSLKLCKGVAYADANLSDWAVDILTHWSGKPQEVIVNKCSKISTDMTFLEGSIDDEKIREHDHYGFLLDMRQHINEGQNISICSDSQIFLESLELYLQTYCKGVVTKRIDGKTSSENDSQCILKNPDTEIPDRGIQVFLYNTSVESGVDISIKEYFAAQYGFYFGVVDCNSFAQLLGRIRDQGVNRYVWARTFSIASNDDGISFSAEAFAHYEKQALMLESNLLCDYAETASHVQMLFQNSYQRENATALQIRAMRNFERANLRECAFEVLRDCGYNITRQVITRVDAVKAAQAGFKTAKETVKTQNVTDIATAHNNFIGKSVTNLSTDANYQDQCALVKAQWCDRLPGMFDPDAMDENLLRLIVYDQPNLIKGMEKLFLANNPTLAKTLAQHRLSKVMTRNKTIPWLNRSSYLETRLLGAVNIEAAINALQGGATLTNDHPIVQSIYGKLQGTISVDGVKGRGSHWLKRSIPKSPIKATSLLLRKVSFPHSVRDGVIKSSGKALNAIAPYRDALWQSIGERFTAIESRIIGDEKIKETQTVPQKTVTVSAVTPVTVQTLTGQELKPEKTDNFCYKDRIEVFQPSVLTPVNNKKTELTNFSPGQRVRYRHWDRFGFMPIEGEGVIESISGPHGYWITVNGLSIPRSHCEVAS